MRNRFLNVYFYAVFGFRHSTLSCLLAFGNHYLKYVLLLSVFHLPLCRSVSVCGRVRFLR
uniref:MIP17054p n=1 Tax=Drosophila melanogaster TaxID=7227 RepID=D3DMU0_DROME|nr:MIP17054p [Drosophila melanogaster]